MARHQPNPRADDAHARPGLGIFASLAPVGLDGDGRRARVDSPAVTSGIDRETRQLVEYLVTLGVQENDLPALLELCKRL